MTGTTTLAPRLQQAARFLDLELSHDQQSKLLLYVEQMERWNRTYNLTAIRDREQMLIQHVFDSLAVVPYVAMLLDKKTVSDCTLVDVGSGGGLPGVVLAIMGGWSVHCVDAVQKKMAFVQQMSATLALPNLHAHHARIEKLPPFDADVVISRAFSSLSDFASLSGRHVASGGCLLAMKGREPHDEIQALESGSDWQLQHVENLSVPELDAQRCVLRLSRQEAL